MPTSLRGAFCWRYAHHPCAPSPRSLFFELWRPSRASASTGVTGCLPHGLASGRSTCVSERNFDTCMASATSAHWAGQVSSAHVWKEPRLVARAAQFGVTTMPPGDQLVPGACQPPASLQVRSASHKATLAIRLWTTDRAMRLRCCNQREAWHMRA